MAETKPLYYYFTSAKYALEDVQAQYLKAAELDNANDPFEHLAVRTDDQDDYFLRNIQTIMAAEYKILCFSKTYKEPSL